MAFIKAEEKITVEHWADRHIGIVDFGGKPCTWAAYDESGNEYGRYPTKSAARQALIAYGDTL